MNLVPKDAIVLGGVRPLVFVVDLSQQKRSSGTVRPVPVTLGVSSGDLIQVIGPLDAGEQVVVRGNERLRAGQEITFRQPPARGEKSP